MSIVKIKAYLKVTQMSIRLRGLKEKHFLSLRTRLLFLLLTTIVPFTLFIFYEMHKITDHVVNEVQKENMTIAKQIANVIDEYIVSTGELLQAITRNHHVRSLDYDYMRRWFKEIVPKYKYYANIIYVDNAGYIRASGVITKDDKPINVRGSTCFQRAINSGSLTIGDFTYSKYTGVPAIHISYPVYDMQNRRQGFVSAVLDLTKIQNRLFLMNLPETILVAVVDKSGIIIARSQEPEKWVGKNMRNEIPFKRMVGKGSGFDKVKGSDGKVRIVAFTQVPKTGWYVKVCINEKEVIRRVEKELYTRILMFIPVFLVAFFGWLWIGLDLEKLHRKLQYLSLVDPLTGIWNGRKFNIDFEIEYLRARRHNKKLSFSMIDLDNFKDCNDTYGHLFGDECLIAIANLIKESIRNVDLLYRYGGDEFSLLMPETDDRQAYVVLERVRKNLENFKINVPGMGTFGPLTASIGYSTYPDDATTPEELIKNADRALYTAKKTGRNKTIYFGNIVQTA